MNIRPTKLCSTDQWISLSDHPKKLNIRPTKIEHQTYKRWTSDLQSYVQPTNEYYNQIIQKVEHQTYKSWTSDLRKLNIWPTHLRTQTSTYKAMFNRPMYIIIRTSDPQKSNIRPTKLCSTDQRISLSDHPKKLNIRSTKVEHQTYKRLISDLQSYVQPTNEYY